MNIGQLLCRIGIHKDVDITIKSRTDGPGSPGGGPGIGWPGCRRCHRLKYAYILDRRPGGCEVDWTERTTGPRWGFPAEKKRN